MAQSFPSGDASLKVKESTTILDEASVAASATTLLADCDALDLSRDAETLTTTIEATFNALAALGIKVHVRTSTDGVNFDTEDWDSWTPDFAAGATIRQTKSYDAAPYAIKILIENLDAGQAVTGVKAITVS